LRTIPVCESYGWSGEENTMVMVVVVVTAFRFGDVGLA